MQIAEVQQIEAAPMLARHVRLAGEMPDVGFQERQWLVERQGHFIQVTELLYRLLAQIDGTRTAAEIARAVTACSEWALEPEHVEYLIEHKLRPLRLVGESNAEAPSAASGSTDSPLRLAMRTRMLPPPLVDPLASALRHLYAPPALLVIGLMIALAHWWLYATHRVTDGLQAAFYAPGGLLAVLALGIAAGLFHELGHAAALRYGGGRSRGIGVGLYLMFPAFYSDVTDSYRLPRRARVRTDLGGIYFHLIFAAALIGLAAAFGSKFLIAAVLVFNIEAFRQLMPFVRLDGYWLLADLTGIPDFFSQMKAFGGRAVPGRRPGRVVLPALKPWVRVAFTLYILTTIPALIWLLVLTVLYVPDLVVLTGRALDAQVQLFSSASGVGTRVLAATQIALVPLPLIATSYFLCRLLMVGVRHIAREGFPVRIPRFAGAVSVAVAAAVMAAIIARPGAESPATRAVELLRASEKSTRAVETLRADFKGVINGEPFGGRLTLRRPNQARVDVAGSESVGTFNVVSDGSKVYAYFPADNRFTEAKTAADGRNIDAFIVDPVRMFFRPGVLFPRTGETPAYKGREQIGNAAFDVVDIQSSGERAATVRYHISTSDGLVHRITVTTSRSGKSSTRWVQLEAIRLNGRVDDAPFRWTVPAGATPLTFATLGVQVP
jgi:putative peptide zinc metalloprotease protein